MNLNPVSRSSFLPTAGARRATIQTLPTQAAQDVFFAGKRERSIDFNRLKPAEKLRVLHARMYTDLLAYTGKNAKPKPAYLKLYENQWIALYKDMVHDVLHGLSHQKHPHAHAFFSELLKPVETMEAHWNERFLLSQDYDKARRQANDNLNKLMSLELTLAIADPAVRAAALEDIIPRLPEQKKTPWYLR